MKKMMYTLALLVSVAGSQMFGLSYSIYNYTDGPLDVKLNLKDKNDRNLELIGDDLFTKVDAKLTDSFKAIEVWGPRGRAKLFKNEAELEDFKKNHPQTEITEDMTYAKGDDQWLSGVDRREINIYPNKATMVDMNGQTRETVVGGYRIEVR